MIIEATEQTIVLNHPIHDGEVLITGRIGAPDTVLEILARWDGARWIAGHGERIFSVASWREVE